MFIELNYPDSMGSTCPFCGKMFFITMKKKKRIEYPGMTSDTKVYMCLCPNDHAAFVKVTSENRDDVYTYYRTLFVYERDWWDHVESPFYSSIMQNEDRLWQRELRLQKAQKIKSRTS